jgi:hypothetical protein
MALGMTRLTRQEAAVRQDGWLRDGVIAGFVATFAMTIVLAAAYGLAEAIGDRDGSTVLRWFWNLANNPVTERGQDGPFIAIALNLAVGLALALVYARFAEPILPGPGWREGMIFSLLPWLFSIVFFLPIMGGGWFGMDIDAGPLPILGNLILHLVYGAVLGTVYGLRLEQGLTDTPAERKNAERAERGAALGVAFGVVAGLVVGWLFSSSIDDVANEALVATIGALVGGAMGMLVGSMVGMGDVFVAHE